MSSAHPAKNGSKSDASPPPSVPIGVRTHAVVSGRWVAVALTGALGLAALVFFLLPAWLSPSRNTQGPPVVVPKPAPPAAPRTADPAETVRQRLRSEEAASRYQEQSKALAKQRAPTWAPDAWAAATARGDGAAAAVVARDYARAIELYDDATRRLTAISGQAEAAYGRALSAGKDAIEARASADAANAFQLALTIRPGDKEAQHGLGRAERLDEVLARLAAGEAQESAGALAQARREYAAAVALDPEFAPARAALMRVDGRLAAQRFDQLMTQGLAHLERRDWSGAERSFNAALKTRPGHPSAADGLARAKEGLQRDTLARLQREAGDLEAAERWQEALAAHRRAEAIDPTVDFAREGITRSGRMIALHARIDGYLAEPRRLLSASVRDEARKFLASLDKEQAGGPRLAQGKQSLETALERATTKITVRLASDNATEVTVYRVGRLGRFQDREVTLTPGTYTLVGSRPGYKDVRVELIVAPDSNPPRIYIACEERV
jgi:eukaryotic-like serine/threonine-protein kinase